MAVTDWRFPSANAPGSPAWVINPQNCYADDGLYATHGNTAAQYFYGFGFTIPAGSTIDGIEVAREDDPQFADNVWTLTGRLTKDVGGTITLVGETKSVVQNTDGWTVRYYGGAADTWIASLTLDDVNHNNFGIYLKDTRNSGTAGSMYTDYVKIRIYYTETSEPSSAYVYSLMGEVWFEEDENPMVDPGYHGLADTGALCEFCLFHTESFTSPAEFIRRGNMHCSLLMVIE